MSFSGVVGLPWEPVPGREGIEVKSSVAFAKETDGSKMSHETEDADKKKKVRAVYISRADISRYNLTPGCEGCMRANRGDALGNHSDECRIRVERLMAEEKAPKYEKAMSRLAEEALKEDEKKEKKTRVRSSVEDYTREDWEQVAKKDEKGVAFVPSSSSTTGNEKRPAAELPDGERNSKPSHVEPSRGSKRASPSDPVSPSKKLKVDELGPATTVDLDDCVPSGKQRVFRFRTDCIEK